MFNVLSSQTTLLTLLSRYSPHDIVTVSVNFKLMITLLNQSTSELLDNRRTHGVLLPQEEMSLDKEHIQSLSCEQILLQKDYLIETMNTFCLTEAIIVRNNFSNCLEFITEQALDILPAISIKPNALEKVEVIEKSNVSPIRLTEIKQRLAQAVQLSTDKQASIKIRLNQLLDKPTVNVSKIPAKQA